LAAFLRSCRANGTKPAWTAVCDAAAGVAADDADGVRQFFQAHFRPYRLVNPDGSDEGLITGYFEPVIEASREPGPTFAEPIYGPPDDMLTIDLGELYPELKKFRLRGRLEGRRVVPYFDRAGIEARQSERHSTVLYWARDAVELFFLQVQGSGQLQLVDGSRVRVGYADQNGHPYRSIGRWLVEQGELKLEEASMQGIQAWARANPQRLRELLEVNPSYVFFRDLGRPEAPPPGAQGVALTDGRSLAVDPRAVPLGAPVWLATDQPNSDLPLQRLMVAQDTGGAIKGVVRADFFWGSGPEAGAQAGRMKQRGRMWVLLPVDYPVAE
jgi:membrane-bound lytic murein transglycosylase A